MPASRATALADRLNSRSNTGRAVPPAAGTFTITSWVLPAGRNTSLCTRETPGRRFPSSATRLNPGTAAATVVGGTTAGVVTAPTIDGTCMRKPALTKRTNTVPVTPVAAAGGRGATSEVVGLVLLNATPLIK